MIKKISRRDFLKKSFVSGVGVLALALGGESLFAASRLNAQVVVGSSIKNITIVSGQTALNAINSSFGRRCWSDGTSTIAGIRGKWAYTVNGDLPSVSASRCKLTKDSRIVLIKIY